MIYVVTIQDKTLYGEPDIALAVVDAPDEQAAARAAYPTIEQLADAGRGRCVPHVRAIEPGKFYRLGALVRLAFDPNAETQIDPAHKAQIEGVLGRTLHADELVRVDALSRISPVERLVAEELARKQIVLCALYLRAVAPVGMGEAMRFIDALLNPRSTEA